MSAESEFIEALRSLASHPAARGLLDDAAVLEIGETRLVLTHDMIVEGVHFLAGDRPEDVAWKLVAVNLSDLAAKGALPLGVLLGFSLRSEAEWERKFVDGLSKALSGFGIALLGGDTVSVPADAPRTLALTALGTASGLVPARAGACPGDLLWVSGTIGDAGAGLEIAAGKRAGPDELVERYRFPRPRVEAGRRLAPLVTAMMDVSDGLLLDARRLAHASSVRARIELESLPLSSAYLGFAGGDRASRIDAATAGDDYELLFTACDDRSLQLLALSDGLGVPLSRIGRIEEGRGVVLLDRGEEVPLPVQLGYEHG